MVNKVTLSLSSEWVEKIDKARGDVPRSRFIFRLIEKYFGGKSD